MTSPIPQLSDTLAVHTLLDDLFLAHQAALLDRHLPAAAAWLDQFAEALAQHIADEEEWILPAYIALGDFPEGARPDFFQAEHGKLQRSLAEIREMLIALEPVGRPLQFGQTLGAPDPSAVSIPGVIAVLDREASFKDLFRHHDARERTFLYPILDARLPESERERLWSHLVLKP